MNIPMSWIKDYVALGDMDIVEYTDGMTMSGTKVEGYEKLGEEVTNVVVGQITKIEKHPDAEKLIVCQVNVGENIQIVTGANNVSEGDYIPVALHGSTLPGDIKIKKGKLRGIVSEGMMCSVEELGYTTEDFPEAPEHGIYLFDQAHPVGSDVKPLFGLDDTVVEYELTSNRPDCQSILGIAREAAITFDKEFTPPNVEVKETGEGNAHDYATVEIKNPELCNRYAARIVKNVKIGPSPKWMRERLLGAGIRPINNFVDITNFILLEYGQPMHAFDLGTLAGNKIVVRTAEQGEKFVTLDEEERELDDRMLVIADGEKSVAVAGVMGGENSKVRDEVDTILFESANFNGTSVRLTSKRLGLRTDASSKFEKGLDPNNVVEALNRACQLVVEMGAGEIVPGIIDEYPIKREEKSIEYKPEQINALLGTDIPQNTMEEIFTKVGCKVEGNTVTAPTFRPDLERVADLSEEVARFYGYNNIPTTIAKGSETIGKKNYKQQIEDMTKTVMEGSGLNEAMIYSFESPKVFDKLNISEENELRNAVRISNPLGEDFSLMRTQSINGMLQALSLNYNRRNESAYLYELGKVYLPKALPLTELPDERMKLTLGLYGKDVDFYVVKGILENLFEKFGISEKIAYEPTKENEWLHPGRQGNITIDTKVLGVIGEVHPDILDNYEIGTRAYLAVIDMPLLTAKTNLNRDFEQLPKYPAMSRDIAMLVKEDILVREIEDVIKLNGGKNLESVELFDVYQGEQIEKGFKSVAYNITFRAKDKTLKEKEVNKQMTRILKQLEQKLEAQLRQ